MKHAASKKVLNTVALLSLAGLVISAFQMSHFFDVRTGQAAFASFCKIGAAFDCNAIDASPYAELFGGLPLAAAAAGWFLAILVLSLLARTQEFSSVIYPWTYGMSAWGTLVSIIYLVIMTTVLKVGCLLCLGVDTINFALLGILHFSKPKQATARGPLSTGIWVTAISLGVAIVAAKGMQGEAPPRAELSERINSILSSAPVAMSLPPKLLSTGSSEARVTIVKFSDFQCPSCRAGAQTLHPVLRRYEGKIRFVYRNFPLDSACNRLIQRSMHPHACELAAGAVCADSQQKFEPYYEKIFDRQASLKAGSAVEAARELGLDVPAFEACLKDPGTQARISQDIEEGITLNVESTPTFFVNGHRISGAQPPEVWNAVLDQLLR
jgi:protein-disulfide isomerase/uncharacterized membrane protein